MNKIIKAYNIPYSPKRIAIFASYSKNSTIDEYVVYYLKELRKVADAIIFVSDNETTETELKKIEDYIIYASCYHHGGYDFGSYKLGYTYALQKGLLENAEELMFLNDSCYGPIYPLQEVFTAMDSKDCDFWGFVDSHEQTHHICPFFYVFKKQVFNSVTFSNFVFSWKPLTNFWDYVNFYERRFTHILTEQGFKADTYISVDKEAELKCAYQSGNGNLCLFPLMLTKAGMPLVKRKALNGTFGDDLQESPSELLKLIKQVNPTIHDIIVRDLDKQQVVKEDKWLSPQDMIGDKEVVSFDIFDTLLSRPYAKPTDLFKHLELEENAIGFAKERINAEAKARRVHSDQADVTLAQIYDVIPKRYRHLQEKEQEFEHDMLYVKKEGKIIYDEAVRQNKKIIAVSDMYLPKDFIVKLLKEKGYTEISEVFVSNEENACKGDGKLFTVVLDKLNISKSSIVHIGDNKISDKQAPEKIGIQAYWRQSDPEKIMTTPALARLHNLAKSNKLSHSIVFGILTQYKAYHNDFTTFHDFGYELGGPLAIGYVTYIHEVAKQRNIDGILFVSRDGYALYEVYKKMYPNDTINIHYIQASRKLVLRNHYQYSDPEYTKNVYELFANECHDGITIEEKDYPKYEDEIKAWCDNNQKQYEKYIDSLHVTGQKLMTVDMTTREYTSLKMLKTVFGDRIDCGMFSFSYGEPCEYPVLSYATRPWTLSDIPCIEFQEELITAPEFSPYKITETGDFLRNDKLPAEQKRIENYKIILGGILHFTDDYIRLTNKHRISLTCEDWFDIKDYFVSCQNYGTRLLLKDIIHEDGNGKFYKSLYETIYEDNGIHKTDFALDYKELEKLRKKRTKYLKAIRKLSVTSGIEAGIILILLAFIIALL